MLLFDLGARCDAPAVVGLQVGFAGPLLLLLLVALPAAMLLSLPQNFPLLARLYRCTSGIGREVQQARPLCCAPGAGKSAGATATRVGGQVMMARPGDVMKAELARRRAEREREQREREAAKREGNQAQPGWCGTRPVCDCDCCCWESSARAGSGRHQRKGCWRRTCSPPEGCGTRYTHVRPDGELLQDGDDPDAPWPLWWGAWLAGMRVKKYAWWAPLLLVRQAIMAISTAALAGAGTRVQAYGLLGVLSCSVIAQALTRPYVTKWLNGLELSCLLVQATSVLLGLLAYDDGVNSNARGGFGYAVLVLNLAPVAAAVLTALYVALLAACAAYSAGHCAFMCPCMATPDDNEDETDGMGDNKGSDEFSMEAGEAVSGLALAARARRKEQARAARAAKREAGELQKQRIADLTAGANPMTLGSAGADQDGGGSGGRSSLIRAAANQNAAMRPIDEAAGVNPLLGLSSAASSHPGGGARGGARGGPGLGRKDSPGKVSQANPLDGFRSIAGGARAARSLGVAGARKPRSRSTSNGSQSSQGSEGGNVGEFPASSLPLTGASAGLVRHLALQAKERKEAARRQRLASGEGKRRSVSIGSDDAASDGEAGRANAILAARRKAEGLEEEHAMPGDALGMGGMGGGHGGVMRMMRMAKQGSSESEGESLPAHVLAAMTPGQRRRLESKARQGGGLRL